ncbi:DUF3298 and DUF4163 domain-containing protein [Lewinella sp. IMCC34183]|uniref:DUF3298 and DUF4163 domain-containing protein n=1 Tax=Lewinella sp. IMCC34183 TaxID=2248762 RepID=UPI000E26FC3D|nr:DUF3298 and DUF4163 domain-containing protein [Lewinella sp. IMCC34183]
MRIFLYVLLCLSLASCGADSEPEESTAAVSEEPAPPLRLTDYTYADSTALRSGGPYFTFELQTLRAIDGPAALRDTVNTVVDEKILGYQPGPIVPFDTALIRHLATAFADYRNQPVDEGLLEESEVPYTQEEIHRVEEVYRNDRLLVLSHLVYVYTGGAHGMTRTDLLPFRVNPARQLTYDDLFRPGADAPLSDLLTRLAHREMPERVYVDTVPVTSNLAPLPGGMRFLYDPYAIGPYASGNIALDVPYDSLRPWLTEEALALIP